MRPFAAAAEPAAVVVEMPGKLARHLHDHTGLGEAERQALQQGRMVRRGQGYSLHITTTPDIHRALLHAADALNTDGTSSAERKACRSGWSGSRSATAVRIAPRLTRCWRDSAAMLVPVRYACRTSSTTPSCASFGRRPDVAPLAQTAESPSRVSSFCRSRWNCPTETRTLTSMVVVASVAARSVIVDSSPDSARSLTPCC